MGSLERKSICVITKVLHGSLPTSDRMAILAAGTKLAAVDVGMAIRTFIAHVLEDRADVTAGARHITMHTTKCVTGFFVMVEIGPRANRFPASSRVASLASDFHWAVRIACAAWQGGLSGSRRC
jgi:hypothetical protein